AVERYPPDRLLGAGRIAGRIRDVPLLVGTAAADVDQPLRVRSPLETADGLAVIRRIPADLPAAILRRLGHPDIADPLRVFDPGQLGSSRRGQQLGWERRREKSLKRDRRRLGGDGEAGQQDERGGESEARRD